MMAEIYLKVDFRREMFIICLEKTGCSRKLINSNKEKWIRDNYTIAESNDYYQIIIKEFYPYKVIQCLKKMAKYIFKISNEDLSFYIKKDAKIKSLIDSIIQIWDKDFVCWENSNEYCFSGNDSCAILSIVSTIIEELGCDKHNNL